MGTLAQYRYSVEMQYLNIKNGTYTNIFQESIKYVLIDRDYDKYNMPLIYVGLTIDKNLADDMKLNYRENLINIKISRHEYDPDDDDWILNWIEDDYINGQCEYFTEDSKINDNKEIDYGTEENEDRADIYTNITIGLMRLSLINQNKRRFNMTLYNTTMTNALMTVTQDVENLVLEPLSYNDVLEQIIVPSVDSISKAVNALNNVKVLYSTPYRFFMDFDATYLISSEGNSVPRKGQRITDLLISIKKATDTEGMIEGVYINRKQKNYQINISSTNVEIKDNQISEKTMTDVVGINTSGAKQEVSIDMDQSVSNTAKFATIAIPNDNLNMIQNIKAEAETNGLFVTITKDNIDSDIININSLVVIHHLDENTKYNGQYILYHKRELLLSDGLDFTMTVVANYKKLRKVV